MFETTLYTKKTEPPVQRISIIELLLSNTIPLDSIYSMRLVYITNRFH